MSQIPTLFERLQQLTGINQDEYSRTVFDTGIKCAEIFTGGDKRAANCITQTKIYWSWYTNQFEIIDLQFVNSYLFYQEDSTIQPALLKLWNNEHQPDKLNTWPHKEIMEAGYAVMIGKANKELIAMEVAQ